LLAACLAFATVTRTRPFSRSGKDENVKLLGLPSITNVLFTLFDLRKYGIQIKPKMKT